MKYINIISTILIAIIISSCQSNNFEQENDAVFKSIRKTYTLNSDGSINYQYQHKLKYITHYSFNRAYGESFIIYNPNQQEIKINKAETRMVDGKIVPSPDNAFNEVLPRFAAGAPAFNHLREMVVTHTGLEPGCMVDFDYELNSKADYLPFFNENIILQERVPVEKLEIIVNVHNGTTINAKLLNIDSEPKISKKDGYTQYTWKFANLKGLANETNQPHNQSFLPRLTFSNINMKDALSEVYNNIDLSLNDDIKMIVTKRIFGKEKGIHIIKELQNMIGNEMNTYRVPIEYTAYSARPSTDVWKSNGGTELEKTLLLNECIKHSGIESKVIMAIPSAIYYDQVGNLKDFGHYYIMTNTDGEDIIISINSGQENNLAFDIKDDVIIDLKANAIPLPDFISEEESKIITKGDFQINESGDISGKIDVTVNGIKNPYIHYINKPEDAKEIVASLFSTKSIVDFDVIKFDNKQSEVKATIEDKEVWKNQDNYYFIEIPASSFGIKGEHLYTLLNERETPLHLTYPVNESYDFTISIPEGFSFVAPEIKKELSNETGSVIIEISCSENVIHIVKNLKINKQEVHPSEYSAFKNIMDLWNKSTYKKIIIKKIETE
ncbi:MAG: DUF3857 domain-containing protein [Bacteroidales bacterium]|nr:DUF3857 domain-containing protein [Bacteroidales bacterium]